MIFDISYDGLVYLHLLVHLHLQTIPTCVHTYVGRDETDNRDKVMIYWYQPTTRAGWERSYDSGAAAAAAGGDV